MVSSKTVKYIEEKRSRWVLENFSSLQDNNNRYSGTFLVAGCNWRLRAYCKDYTNGYLSLYLELADTPSLPSGWRKEVKFCLTLVNRIRKQSNKALEGQRWFDATNYGWGFKEFWLIDKLHAKGPEFLVRDKLIIVVEVQILPAIDVAEDIVKITEPQSCKEENQANDDDEGPHDDHTSQEGLDDDDASQEDLDDDDASQEDLDDDDAAQEDMDDHDAAQEDLDDDASPVSDDEGWENVKITEPLSSEEGNQATDASQEDLDNDDESQEGLDDDGSSHVSDDGGWETVKITEPLSSKEGKQATDASQEDLDDDNNDDGSFHISDDGGRDAVKLTETLSCKEGNQGTDEFNEGSHNDDASKEDLNDDDTSKEDLDDDDDGSSLVSNDEDNDEDGTVEENPDDDTSSLHQLKSMVDTTKTIENGGTGCNNKAIVFDTLNNCLKEIQPAKQTVDVYGFQVLTCQVKSVTHIFKRHPNTALDFRPKNQHIRRAYMDELLRLIETLCQSPEKLSDDDLSNADETFVDLIDVGFKLDWLKKKLDEISEKKKIEQSSVATLQTMEEQLQKLKNMVLDFESQLQKEKVKALAARTSFSFEDVVC